MPLPPDGHLYTGVMIGPRMQSPSDPPEEDGEPITYDDALDEVLHMVRQIGLRRHRRYGLNLLRHGEMGICVRVDDKTERIMNMVKAGTDDAEESLFDTWSDIAGYALQAMLIRRRWFELPMQQEYRSK